MDERVLSLPDTCSRSKASIEELKSRNVTGAAVLIAKIKAISRTKKGDLRTGQRKSIRQKSPSKVANGVKCMSELICTGYRTTEVSQSWYSIVVYIVHRWSPICFVACQQS
jgi:hypothetical protein